MIETDDNDDAIMGGYSRSQSPIIDNSEQEYEREYYGQTCEYCGQEYDIAELHYVSLTYHADKTVWRCEACRLDMKMSYNKN